MMLDDLDVMVTLFEQIDPAPVAGKDKCTMGCSRMLDGLVLCL